MIPNDCSCLYEVKISNSANVVLDDSSSVVLRIENDSALPGHEMVH
jgi:hypothetical protein